MENKKQFIRGIAVGVVITAVVAGGASFGSRALTKVSDEKKAESGELNLTSTAVEELRSPRLRHWFRSII